MWKKFRKRLHTSKRPFVKNRSIFSKKKKKKKEAPSFLHSLTVVLGMFLAAMETLFSPTVRDAVTVLFGAGQKAEGALSAVTGLGDTSRHPAGHLALQQSPLGAECFV